MDNIKRCNWCWQEFSDEGKMYRPSGQDKFIPICSSECFGAICNADLIDLLEDKKYERNAPLSARQKVK